MLILAMLVAAPPGQLMAVLEFKTKLKGAAQEEIDPAYLTDVVRATALRQHPGLRVMTRENMLVLLGARRAEDCEGECEVDTGRKLGADLVITGQVLKFGSKYKLNLKLHETHDGRLLAGAQASGRTADELDQSLQGAVAELLQPLRADVSEDDGAENGIEGGVAGGVVGGVVSPPPAPAPKKQEPKPPPKKEEPAPQKQVALAPPVTQRPPPAAQPQPQQVEEQRPAVVAPAPAPAARGAFGVYAGGLVDPSAKTFGQEVSLVLAAGDAELHLGAMIAPHPGVRVSVPLMYLNAGAVRFGLEPRLLVTPIGSGTVIGAGAGLRVAAEATRWLDVVGTVAYEAYHTPTDSFTAPLIALGLEVRP